MSKGHFFTDIEKEWVKNTFLNTEMSCQEIAKEFNEKFDTSDKYVSQWAISDLMSKRMKIKRGFNKTQFGRGKVKQHMPIGTVYKKDKDGYIRIKIGCSSFHKRGASKKNYMHLHQYIYEQHYGKIKRDEIIIFADGNPENLSLDNLIKISRKQNAELARNHLHSAGKATKAAVECMKLMDVMENMQKGQNND